MRFPDKQLALLTVENMVQYFYSIQWSVDAESNQKVVELLSPPDENGKSIQLYLPARNDYLDYERKLKDTIMVLSTVFEKSIDEVVNDVLGSSVDVFRAAISPFEINLGEAYTNIRALKNMFLFAATSITEPKKNYKNASSHANTLLQRFNFGHTYAGSFGFIISSNVAYELKQIPLVEEEKRPEERIVIEKVITGLNDIMLAAKERDSDIIVRNFEKGLNSKMCDAIMEFSAGGLHETKYSIAWGKNVKPKDGLDDNFIWTFNREHYEVLDDATRKLKEFEPMTTVLRGRVVTLHSLQVPDGDKEFSGIVYMKTEIDSYKTDVKLTLNRFNYNKAIKAHKSGHEILATGILSKKGNTYSMDIQSVKLV